MVAYLLCAVALAPFVDGQLGSVVKLLGRMVLLQAPEVDGVFPGTHYAALNGSMWTISYEFRCYLLVMIVGLLGLLSKRIAIAVVTTGLLALAALHPAVWEWFPNRLALILGDPQQTVKFVSVFGCGALFHLYRHRIRYDGRLAVLAFCGLLVLMSSPLTAEAALATLGGYVLFWFAFNVKSPRLAAIGRKVDLSYGVYLYAWPVQKLLIWSNPQISPWLVFIETTAIACALAYGSWRLVEKPFLNLKAAFAPTPVPRRANLSLGPTNKKGQ